MKDILVTKIFSRKLFAKLFDAKSRPPKNGHFNTNTAHDVSGLVRLAHTVRLVGYYAKTAVAQDL